MPVANALEITSVTIAGNGENTNAIVTLSGVPAGTLGFVGRTSVGGDAVTLQYQGLGNAQYIVGVFANRFIHISATDDNGESAESRAFFPFESPYPYFPAHAMGRWLADSLSSERDCIDFAIHQEYPECDVQDVVFGNSAAITKYPSILVQRGVRGMQWLIAPMGMDSNLSRAIECVVTHPDPNTRVDIAEMMGESVIQILASSDYREGKVGSFYFSNGHISNMEISETQVGETLIVAKAILQWEAMGVTFFA
jgi:hypothetical protein